MKIFLAILMMIIGISMINIQGTESAPQFALGDKGIGVDFLGFTAGIFNNGSTLVAQAGTPTGQTAQAGFGGEVNKDNVFGTLLAGAQASNDTKAAAQLTGLAGKPGVFGVIESASSSGGQLSGSSLGGSVGNDGRPTGFYDTVQNVQQNSNKPSSRPENFLNQFFG